MSEQPAGRPVQYEKTDVDLRAVARAGIAIAVVATVVALALIPVLRQMAASKAKADPAPAPIPHFAADRQPPAPRLQGQPFADWQALKAEQAAQLDGYGWVDEAQGVVHIPIREAMRMVAERGLPARTAAAVAPAPAASPSPAAAGAQR